MDDPDRRGQGRAHRLRTGLAALALVAVASSGARAERVAAFLDPASSALGGDASTALAILRAELGERGLVVAEVRGLGEEYPGGEAAREVLEESDVRRVFVLTVRRLGRKVVVALTERGGPILEATRSERMSASRVEELDLVIPRLVGAVLARAPVEEGATVATVTDEEGREWRKKYGEFLWGVGLPVGVALRSGSEFAYGAAARGSYEMEHARLDLALVSQFSGGDEDLAYLNLAIEAYYLFSTENVSPYLGGGFGYGFSRIDSDEVEDRSQGVILNVGGGVEFFRLYEVRLLVDAKVGFPTYELHDRGESFWVPVLTGSVALLW